MGRLAAWAAWALKEQYAAGMGHCCRGTLTGAGASIGANYYVTPPRRNEGRAHEATVGTMALEAWVGGARMP